MDGAALMTLALERANEGFEDIVAELVEAADGNIQALLDANADLQKQADKAGTPEHIAFTYLAAAFSEATKDAPRRSTAPD